DAVLGVEEGQLDLGHPLVVVTGSRRSLARPSARIARDGARLIIAGRICPVVSRRQLRVAPVQIVVLGLPPPAGIPAQRLAAIDLDVGSQAIVGLLGLAASFVTWPRLSETRWRAGGWLFVGGWV